MKSRPASLLLLFFLVSVNGFFSIPVFSENPWNNTMRFELIHRHSPELSMRPKTQLDRIKELVHSDNVRQQMISHKLKLGRGLRRMASEIRSSGSMAIPLRSGADRGIGQYFVSFRVGTPVQKFVLIADTGSDLTWMNCNYGCDNNNCPKRRLHHRRIFHAHHSSSFKTVPCFSKICKVDLMKMFSLTRCPTPMTPCAYDYSYSDESSAQGIFVNETVTVGLTNGRKIRLHDVLIGCSETFRGRAFSVADGVMGLGYNKYSFAVKAAEMLGGKFSYCLVDHLSPSDLTNYLSFGGSTTVVAKNMQYTKLVVGVIDSFYAVNVAGISIGGKMLNIPFKVWDVGGAGGTIIDSGSSLTLLTEPAYHPVMAALKAALTKFQSLELDIGPVEFCFNSTGFDESVMPRFAFHFADGVRFEPPVKSYVIDAADGIKCLGFASTDWPGTVVIGNIMQQNHLWEFDLVGNKLGFAPSTCT
ncbi:hypothetical protein HHK36_004615 [Tetracentron sinense]|uniref:Peptidase A1 domain-containing protein n=1 Tax=Tetracentron sinense TaxID=13715 RepID=A0A834ZLI8_TETSI|nr:hypothetical protein HHK36_004615 [Tetracentron sinense]